MTDSLRQPVTLSVIGHGVVVALILFRAVTAPDEPLSIHRAIRVDVVGLPEKTVVMPEQPPQPAPPKVEVPPPPPPPQAKAPPAPPVVKPKPTVNTANAEKHALDKLKEMSALEKIKQDVNKAKASKAAPANVVRGNQVAVGNSLTGLEKIEFDRYFDEIENKVHAQWNIPKWLADADFKAQVLVQIDDRGNILRKTFKKSSGNEVFDAKVVEAIDASSPLPPPPARLRGLLSTSGIVFNFPQ